MSVLVVGSANMDLIAQVSRLPNKGETIHGSSFSSANGGKGANQAVAAARLQQKTAMIAAVGTDEYGQVLADALAAEGIDTTGITRMDGESGTALITVEDSGQNTIVVIGGANNRLTTAQLTKHEHCVTALGAQPKTGAGAAHQ